MATKQQVRKVMSSLNVGDVVELTYRITVADTRVTLERNELPEVVIRSASGGTFAATRAAKDSPSAVVVVLRKDPGIPFPLGSRVRSNHRGFATNEEPAQATVDRWAYREEADAWLLAVKWDSGAYSWVPPERLEEVPVRAVPVPPAPPQGSVAVFMGSSGSPVAFKRWKSGWYAAGQKQPTEGGWESICAEYGTPVAVHEPLLQEAW